MAKRPRILLVEDDFAIRTELARLLEEEGYVVASAADGAEGLALLHDRLAPGLIILDLVMPQMDGAEFLREIRRHPRSAALPVVVISANANRLDPALNASAFLPKPIDADALLRVVKDHLRAAS